MHIRVVTYVLQQQKTMKDTNEVRYSTHITRNTMKEVKKLSNNTTYSTIS
jgi:hypothetical protein